MDKYRENYFKGKLVVITGLDGSGTTSLGEFLAKQDPKGYFISTPNDIFSKIRDVFTENIRIEKPASHYHFYLSSVISASYDIREKLRTHNVYCVRYLIDTVVSHRVMGLPVELEYSLGYYDIVQPDLTIFVDIDEDIRKERISTRGMTKLDMVLNDECVRHKFLVEFNRFSDILKVIKNNQGIQHMFKDAVYMLKKHGIEFVDV